MSSLGWAALSALWFGILTSISPCPLATNITAISFVGRRTGSPSGVLLSGLLYTLGRALVYTAIGVLLVMSLLSAPTVSLTLQTWMNKILGPILILVGMVMLGLLRFTLRGRGMSDGLQRRVERWGLLGALALGCLFALSFCPVSATLFFGSLLPLAVKHESGVLLPFVYGIGTALPVVVFAIILAFGARWLGKVFERVTQIERWMRWVTGIIFIGVGIYMSLVYVYRVL
ncbi:sulfite exporter TauE/SafE family protein [Candidatus Bipolaricaulota bacterium]|nr:sulfite exporter TauE/SafE family protein [Candidatus Bipolaricaulota bacterium]